eukprot:1160381-Pelagomonas_calceolata.AAC.7
MDEEKVRSVKAAVGSVVAPTLLCCKGCICSELKLCMAHHVRKAHCARCAETPIGPGVTCDIF